MDSQTPEIVIGIIQIFADGVDNQWRKFMVLSNHHGDCKVGHLLLVVLVARHEIDGLEVAKVNVEAQDVHVQQLGQVLFAVVAVDGGVLELVADVGELLVDALLLEGVGAAWVRARYRASGRG